MIELPDLLPLRITHRAGIPAAGDLDSTDHLAIVICGRRHGAAFARLPKRAVLERAAERMQKRGQRKTTLQLDNKRGTLVSIHRFEGDTPFARLTAARQVVAHCLEAEPARLAVYCTGDSENLRGEALTSIVAAAGAATFALPVFKSSTDRKRRTSSLKLFAPSRPDLARLKAEIRGNNLARWLTGLPPNELTAARYREIVAALAAEARLEFEFLDEKALTETGAGAFLAVAQGNSQRDAGIARLGYRPEDGGEAPLALVGKGIVFDTGGTNLKPFKSMLGMHTDMQGSAVALATGIALAELRVGFAFDVWLAITPNRISATAYTSQDVVRAANGKTIQVIHTDAEGRMVLADALTLAAREDPRLIIDYATLTGACVAALTPRYSGIFTNRPAANADLIENGVSTGERVWAFPMDADYDESLKSEVADIKQCAADGYGDHILAARFLSQFVPESVPWIHMDLSAGNRKGGLAHIPTEITGFGVRYTLGLLLDRHDGPAAVAAVLER